MPQHNLLVYRNYFLQVMIGIAVRQDHKCEIAVRVYHQGSSKTAGTSIKVSNANLLVPGDKDILHPSQQAFDICIRCKALVCLILASCRTAVELPECKCHKVLSGGYDAKRTIVNARFPMCAKFPILIDAPDNGVGEGAAVI